jgi:hypothetical protein
MAAKNNKNKRRKPIKQHAGKKQRETAYDRLDRQIDELMFDVATIADRLLDLLPQFKRLKVRDRQLIYDHMDVVMRGLENSVDSYYDTLPESEEELRGDDLRGLGALLGIGAALGAIASRPPQNPPSDEATEWPDSLDVEYRKVARKPNLLNPKSKGD